MHSVDWDGPGLSTPRLPIQVFTRGGGCSAFVRLLASPEGVWLHWRKELGPKGRSLPHLRAGCPWRPDPWLKWDTYSPVLLR